MSTKALTRQGGKSSLSHQGKPSCWIHQISAPLRAEGEGVLRWDERGHSQCRKSSHAGDKVAVRPAPSLGPMRPAPHSIQYSACMPQQQLQANRKLQTITFSSRTRRTTSRQHKNRRAPHPRCSSDCILGGREAQHLRSADFTIRTNP
jgi:hypothetical protein